MSEWPTLRKPPVREGLLDLQVAPATTIEPTQVDAFHSEIRERYPQRRELIKGAVTLKGSERGKIDVGTSEPQVGYVFTSSDGRQLVQVRPDGFTFNRLAPYTSWEALRSEAREHWDRYRTIVRPQGVARVAVRYVNRIEIPLPLDDFREFVVSAPVVPQGLPQGLASFLVRLVIPVEEAGCVAIVTQTMEAPEGERLPYILDIDVVVERPFKPDDPSIWEALERLRDTKNRFFFASLTEKALEGFR